ncbi:MAG: 2-amino-4-hydroxy-6-hydroxymethyldihydropteridine diphosphokinase [archaeon]|nr:2-amino-4-hydroxy-6-hydroxymethyldihydropteridine diphosphokinase [archaeon]
MDIAIIALGSNIRPKINMEKARKILSREFEIVAETKYVFTKPLVFRDQADFFNGAMLVKTELDFFGLEARLKEIEKELKRVKTKVKAGPRTIDLDIVVWNSEVMKKEAFEWEFLKKEVKELLPALEKELGQTPSWAKNL